jgi:uncharacterized protein (TIGR00266 family)
MTPQPISYKITGKAYQVLEVALNPGETIVAEAGTMVYMDDSISYEIRLGDGSEANPGIMGKLFPLGARPLTGEMFFLTNFTNYGRGIGKIGFSSPYAGVIHRINLRSFKNEVILQRNAFICAPKGVNLSPYTLKKTGLNPKFEVIPFQKIRGAGDIHLAIGGLLIEREINNETIHVDAASIVAFESSIDFSVEAKGNIKSMILGNDASIVGTLSGKGKILIQSLPVKKMIQSISTYSHQLRLDDGKQLGKFDQE